MSIEKSRKWAVAVVVVALVGCGVGPVPAQLEEPLLRGAEGEREPVQVSLREEGPDLGRVALAPSVRPQQSVVSAHSLAAPDGTQVEFMLGMVGCGILVVAQGTATVTGGAFEVPFDPAAAEGFQQLSLYFRVADGACDEQSQVFEAAAPLPGQVDLSQAQATYADCWVFQH
jgi:hypothetical protein